MIVAGQVALRALTKGFGGRNVVDGIDLAAVLGSWGSAGQGKFDTDIDQDEIVSGSDLALVLGAWGTCAP